MRWLFLFLTLLVTSTSAVASKLTVPFQVEAVAVSDSPGQVRIEVALTAVTSLTAIQVDMVGPANAVLTATEGLLQDVGRNSNNTAQAIGTYYYDVSNVRQPLRWKVTVSAESGGVSFKTVAYAVIGKNMKPTINPGRERAGAEEYPSK